MHKLVVMYPYPQNEDKFRAHYVGTHVPLAAKLPGLLGSRYSLAVEGIGEKAPYFCIFEADFADAGAMVAAMTGPQGQAVKADLANFVMTPPVIVHYEVAG